MWGGRQSDRNSGQLLRALFLNMNRQLMIAAQEREPSEREGSPSQKGRDKNNGRGKEELGT